MVASVAIAVNRAPVRLQRQPRPAARAAARPSHRPVPRPLSLPQPASWLPTTIFLLKLLASALAGATIPMLLWPDDWKSRAPNSQSAAPADWRNQESRVARGAPRYTERWGVESDADLDRGIPVNFPRRVKVVIFTPPTRSAAIPAFAPALMPARSPTGIAGANPLAGKRLRYLIGSDASRSGGEDEVTEVSYTATAPARRGISIGYCNLFDENQTGRYGPYLHTSDTAEQYNEGQIDPQGPGWEKNLRQQFERRKKQGFEYIELDNPDAYAIKDVIGAIELAASYGLKVIAKNAGLMGGGAKAYVAHPNVYGVIVERGAGNPAEMEALRRKAGKPDLPVWFVAFGAGRKWAGTVANSAKLYHNMGVTYSTDGEYGDAIDILRPIRAAAADPMQEANN